MQPRRSKRRIDVLFSHLTAESENAPTSMSSEKVASSSSSSPPNKNLLKNLVNNSNIIKEDGVSEPIIQYASEDDDDHEPPSNHAPSGRNYTAKKQKLTSDSEQAALRSSNSNRSSSSSSSSKLVHLCKALSKLGISGGNVEDTVSLRDSTFTNKYWVKPLGIRFEEVHDESHLILTSNLEEVLMSRNHEEIYSSHPEVSCIVESFHADCAMVALNSCGLLPLSQESLRIYGKVKVAEESNLSVRVQRYGKTTPCWLLKNKGFTICGSDAEHALLYSLYVTKACSFQIRAMCAVGGDLKRMSILSEAEVVRARAQLFKIPETRVAQSLFEKCVQYTT